MFTYHAVFKSSHICQLFQWLYHQFCVFLILQIRYESFQVIGGETAIFYGIRTRCIFLILIVHVVSCSHWWRVRSVQFWCSWHMGWMSEKYFLYGLSYWLTTVLLYTKANWLIFPWGALECYLTGRCPFFKSLHNPFRKKICILIPCFGIFRSQNNRKTIGKTIAYCSWKQ